MHVEIAACKCVSSGLCAHGTVPASWQLLGDVHTHQCQLMATCLLQIVVSPCLSHNPHAAEDSGTWRA